MLAALSCGPAELELPEPPGMSGLAQRYEEPTGEVSGAQVEGLLREFLERREFLMALDDMGPITRAIGEFATSTEIGEDGSVEIDGAPIHTDAVLTINGRCSREGTFSFRMIVRQSAIVPIGWGEIEGCRVGGEVPGLGETDLRFSAELSVFVPNLTLSSQSPEDFEFLFSYRFRDVEVIHGEVERDAFGQEGSFRLREGLFEVLLTDGAGGELVFFRERAAEGITGRIGVRAANGVWFCSFDERLCESGDSSQFSF